MAFSGCQTYVDQELEGEEDQEDEAEDEVCSVPPC